MIGRIIMAGLVLTLLACGAKGNPAEQVLLAHTWAPAPELCGSDFIRITRTALEVHHPGKSTTAIQVFKIKAVDKFPNDLMVVVGPHEPGSTQSVSENERVGFVLEVSNKRMRLVGSGSPEHLSRVTADNPNVQRFNRVACS
jgi:hypothetical protein